MAQFGMTSQNKRSHFLSCFAESCTISSYPLHAHECYVIELIHSDQFHNVIDGEDHIIRGDMVFLYMPYTRHYYFSDTCGEANIVRVGFTEGFVPSEFRNLLLSMQCPISLPIDSKRCMKLRQMLQEIMYLCYNDAADVFDELYLKAEISKLITLVYELYSNNKDISCRDNDDKISLVTSYIQNNFRNQISLASLAGLVGMSESYFSRYFLKHQGISYTQYITGLRMNYAVSLLKTSDYSVSKISEAVGYYSVSGFIKSFTKYFGAHPNQFRPFNLNNRTKRRNEMSKNSVSNVAVSEHIPIPVPKNYSPGKTTFPLAHVITAPEKFNSCAQVLRDYLKRMYGFSTEVGNTNADQGIRMVYDPSLEKEFYKIEAAVGLVEITASSIEGFSHGGSIVLQMSEMRGNVLFTPEYSVSDKPDTEWRGFMADLARGQYPLDDILKYADICYYYRLSILHLRFADDSGYFLPSKHFKKLNDSGRYTIQDIEYIKKYLADRGITLIPEIELPGHAKPLTVIYPEIFGGSHIGQVCPGIPKVFQALETLIDEVCELFPAAPYIHIGCDEVPAVKWEKCELCRRFMVENGISSVSRLYSYMVDRCTRMVLDRGHTPIVWEGFPKEGTENISRDVIVMVFQSTYQNAKELTEAGFRVINTSWQPLYIVPSRPKYWQPNEIYKWKYNKWLYEDAVDDSGAIIADKTELVMGGEVCLWEGRDFVSDGDIVEQNMAVSAERLWNSEPVLDYEHYETEKEAVSKKLRRIL